MKRLKGAMMVGALAVMMAASPAKAQYVFLGAGASFPTGSFKTEAKTGFLAQGGVGFDIGDKGLWAEAEGYWGTNKHKAPEDGDKTNIIAGIAALGYSFMADKSVSPYLTGGLGFQSHKFVPETGASETTTKLGYTGAAGLGFKVGAKAHLWVEGRFLGSSSSKMLAALGGFTVQLGK
jgi:opacity protein-like surface antigen